MRYVQYPVNLRNTYPILQVPGILLLGLLMLHCSTMTSDKQDKSQIASSISTSSASSSCKKKLCKYYYSRGNANLTSNPAPPPAHMHSRLSFPVGGGLLGEEVLRSISMRAPNIR